MPYPLSAPRGPLAAVRVMRHGWRQPWGHFGKDCLWDAQHRAFERPYRQKRLGELRERIGLAAYSLGQMPPGVPWWTFEEWD